MTSSRAIVVGCLALMFCVKARGDDTVTTCVEVFDGHLTRTVQLLPVRFAESLQSRLDALPAMNARVVRTMLGYPRDGTHDYWWPRSLREGSYDGATTDVVVAGERVMRGEARGRSFCCGLTLEVFYRTLGERREIDDLWTSTSGAVFKGLWFCGKLKAPGPEDAILAFGMGEKIERAEDVLAGDFVQLWRNSGSGHSVIFVDWARDLDGKVVGIHYWSTQPGTKGISFNTELFGAGGSMVDRLRTSFARLRTRDKWDIESIRAKETHPSNEVGKK